MLTNLHRFIDIRQKLKFDVAVSIPCKTTRVPFDTPFVRAARLKPATWIATDTAFREASDEQAHSILFEGT